ncbi:carboxypeptidase-like regulatory domain-containing protein [Melioribacteraceae bacterium 4301-Me]|uniref:TonB-dependent receptor n=1 Tax=Pyranulibacter aquaticus TaxID=3163344 RepID=UPI00359958EC
MYGLINRSLLQDLKIIEKLKIALSIAAIIGLMTVNIYGGTTGKIAGKVIDASNGEPLVGVNIVLLGTTMGAATDVNGEYYIINIPPGTYQVRASLIGYSPVTIQDVRVSVDQTTKIDFKLTTEAIEIKDVVVTAQKPIVQKDLTSTEAKVSGDQISMLPLEDIQSVVNLQAGVVDGHFRGGRTGEVKYLIDGVSVNDAFSGSSALDAEVNSIQELQVLTGTFNAEYGEALSGVVNQITKIAGNKLEGEISAYSGDYFTNRTWLYPNINKISPKDVYNFQGNLSGPVPGLENLLKFFISGRYVYDSGAIYGRRMFNPSDSSNFSANDPKDWYIGATGDNKYIPMNYNRRFTLQGKISINIGDKGRGLVFNTLYQDQQYKIYDHRFKLNPDGDYNYFQKSFLGSISYTYVMSNSAFLDLVGSSFTTKYNQYVYENPLDPRYVKPERMRDVSGNAFLTGGTENWHFHHTTTTYTAKADLTWQINNIHQIKTGFEYKFNTIDYQDFQVVIDATTNYKPALPSPGSFNFNQYTAHPYQLAGYIQDKIELDYLVVNLGVRLDYFEPDGFYLKNPDNIAVLDQLQPPFPDSLMAKAKAKYQISPRIGLSYPISEKGAVHISYGHFFQIPPFEYLYRNPNFRIPLTGDFPANIGNTIGNTDLDAQQTVMYEIGLQQELTTNLGLTVTGYYKDIRNLLGTEIHIKNEFRKFSKLVNRDYGSVKGFTISFEKRFSDGIGATLDYTFQVAKGNASDPNDAFNKAQANPPIEVNKQLVPLDWDRRHSLNFTLTAGKPGNFIASVIGKLGSGLPYTPSIQNQRTGLENSENRPAYFNVDLYLTKYFDFFGKQISVFAKVYNLFDTANEINVFGDTGRAGYTLELTRAQEAPRGVNTLQEYFTRPDFYSSPRQIIIGASFGF